MPRRQAKSLIVQIRSLGAAFIKQPVFIFLMANSRVQEGQTFVRHDNIDHSFVPADRYVVTEKFNTLCRCPGEWFKPADQRLFYFRSFFRFVRGGRRPHQQFLQAVVRRLLVAVAPENNDEKDQENAGDAGSYVPIEPGKAPPGQRDLSNGSAMLSQGRAAKIPCSSSSCGAAAGLVAGGAGRSRLNARAAPGWILDSPIHQ